MTGINDNNVSHCRPGGLCPAHSGTKSRARADILGDNCGLLRARVGPKIATLVRPLPSHPLLPPTNLLTKTQPCLATTTPIRTRYGPNFAPKIERKS